MHCKRYEGKVKLMFMYTIVYVHNVVDLSGGMMIIELIVAVLCEKKL